MAITINGTGTITGISVGGLNDGIITQPEIATGVAGTGPAFSAVMNANQTISANTFTKIQFNQKDFDTNNNFDTTNYRFTPTVAGYYQVVVAIYPSTIVSFVDAVVYKNGSIYKRSFSSSTNGMGINTCLVYLNGTTDYIEAYANITGTTPTVSNNATLTFFQASMVRAA